MNLVKLFNFKYLMQNIKKSKMAIILFLAIVPIFTSLIIITSASNSYVPSFPELGLANIIFMYVTPFILSFSLFGYVYKKKSIDFIGSMPISRKSIFVTNTVGGIALIVLTQLITFICTLLLGAITESVIFFKLAFDILVFQTIAYIFVFAAANLAMSISGNVVTQIITTILILFTISASVLYVNLWDSPSISLLDEDYRISSNYYIDNEIHYTAPSLIFNDGEYFYNTESLIKMVVLSAIYMVLGYFAFKNKKMEAAGESFENKNIHMLVKGLTLIPFVMILVALVDSDEWEGIMFLIAIIAVYYFVYDLITNKKNKIKENLVMMIVSITVLFGFYTILINVTEDREYKIELTDIKSFEFDTIAYDYKFGIDTKITDITLFEKMLYSNYRDYDGKAETVRLVLNMKNGGKRNIRMHNVSSDVLKEVLKQVENIKLSKNAKVMPYSNINLTNDDRKNLKIEVENALANISLDRLYEINNNSRYYNRIDIYDYKNNELLEFNCSIEISEEVFDIITRASNKDTAKRIQRKLSMSEYIYLDVENTETFRKYMGITDEYYYGYNGEVPDEIYDFIFKNAEKDVNPMKEYIVLNFSGYRFYTNDIETVASILKEYYNSDKKRDYYKYEDIIINTNPNSFEITTDAETVTIMESM